MKEPLRIIILEPQCCGLEHVEVNAGLISIIKSAFPAADILFLAEPEHLLLVEKSCSALECGSVRYQVVHPPARGAGEARRFIDEWGLTNQVLKKAEASRTDWVIFASITGAGLWSVRLQARKYNIVLISVIPHIILASINRLPNFSKPWNWPFWFRLPFVFGNTSQLQFILLGEFIKREVINNLPKMAPYVVAIDLPCKGGFTVQPKALDIESITFGAIGGARVRKGSHLFIQLAKRCRQLVGTRLNFVLVGQIEDEEIRQLATEDIILPSRNRPLSRQMFEQLVMDLDYAVFCYEADSYRFGTSGAFFDALMFLKPIITLRCPSMEYYFESLGDIGYLCDNMEHMYEVVRSISNMPPANRYALQVENLRRGRNKFEPSSLALRLRDLLQHRSAPEQSCISSSQL